MRLNEDFFDDIEIKDDDLKSDSIYVNAGQPNDKTLIKDMFSRYSSQMEFQFDTNLYYSFDADTNYDFWNSVEHMLKRLNYMLDTYNIKHSEPFFFSKRRIWSAVISNPADTSDYHILDFNNHKVIAPVGIKKPESIQSSFFAVVVFFNLPVFKTVKTGYRFFYNMINSIWKKDYIIKKKLFQFLITTRYNSYSNELYSMDFKPIDICSMDSSKADNVLKGMTRHIKYELSCLVPEHQQEIIKARTEKELQALITY